VLKKLLGLFMCAFFAAGFGIGGLIAGIKPLIQTARQALEVKSWQAVQGKVDDVELVRKRGSKGSTLYSVRASYSYDFSGRQFSGSRVGLVEGSSSDNIGNWHQAWYDNLKAAKENGRLITVWVNPMQPEKALLVREIRWDQVMLHLPFALIFTAAGCLAAVLFFFVLFNRRLPLPFNASRTRRNLKHTQNARSITAIDLTYAWLFTFFWCGLSFPFAIMVWMSSGEWFAKAVVSIFTLIGIILLFGVIKSTVDRFRG
jgi:hypothetical protein